MKDIYQFIGKRKGTNQIVYIYKETELSGLLLLSIFDDISSKAIGCIGG